MAQKEQERTAGGLYVGGDMRKLVCVIHHNSEGMAVISHMGTPVPSALEACVIETGFDRSDAQPRTGFMLKE